LPAALTRSRGNGRGYRELCRACCGGDRDSTAAATTRIEVRTAGGTGGALTPAGPVDQASGAGVLTRRCRPRRAWRTSATITAAQQKIGRASCRERVSVAVVARPRK